MIVDEDSLLFAVLDVFQNLFDRKPTRVEIGESRFRISAPVRRRLLMLASLADAPPVVAGHVPCLIHTLGYRMSDREGNVFAEFSGDHFDVGFDLPAARADSLSFSLDGISILVGKLTLSKLNGKTLVMKSVKDGRPDPNSRKRRIMVAE